MDQEGTGKVDSIEGGKEKKDSWNYVFMNDIVGKTHAKKTSYNI